MNTKPVITPRQLAVYTKQVRAADEHGSTPPIRNMRPKIGRNAPCPCGSGKKFKRCKVHES